MYKAILAVEHEQPCLEDNVSIELGETESTSSFSWPFVADSRRLGITISWKKQTEQL